MKSSTSVQMQTKGVNNLDNRYIPYKSSPSSQQNNMERYNSKAIKDKIPKSMHMEIIM